jgi:hypothetical protein
LVCFQTSAGFAETLCCGWFSGFSHSAAFRSPFPLSAKSRIKLNILKKKPHYTFKQVDKNLEASGSKMYFGSRLLEL